MSNTHRFSKETPCAYCKYPLDCAGSRDGKTVRMPVVGDHTVCIKCSGLMEFTDNHGSVRKIDILDVPHECRAGVLEVQAKIRAFQRSKGMPS